MNGRVLFWAEVDHHKQLLECELCGRRQRYAGEVLVVHEQLEEADRRQNSVHVARRLAELENNEKDENGPHGGGCRLRLPQNALKLFL